MTSIYDGLTYEKYPWEHFGTGDRLNYRAYDLFMITKCLFMISLYSTYGGLDDVDKKALYNNYKTYKPKLKAFCEFKVANPDKFRVCQVPGAHIVMHKELQKYNYLGENNKAPVPDYYGCDAVYRPEWHEAGSVQIENPKELKSKLMSTKEALAIYNYYKTAVYSNQDIIAWSNLLVEGNDKVAGAVYSKKPTTANSNSLRLMLSSPEQLTSVQRGDNGSQLAIRFTAGIYWNYYLYSWIYMGEVPYSGNYWLNYQADVEYYAAIVQERY